MIKNIARGNTQRKSTLEIKQSEFFEYSSLHGLYWEK